MEKNKNRIISIVLTVLLVFLLSIGALMIYGNRNAIKNWYKSFIKNYQSQNLPGALWGPKSTQKAKVLDPEQIRYWTNKYRTDNSLEPLRQNSLLTQAAQKKVSDMFEKQYFEHVSPSGIKPADLVSSVGYKYRVTGENLALGDFSSEKDLVDAWMNSPGHRANILSKEYTEIGIATGLNDFTGYGKTWLAVQEFGKPLPDCSKPSEDLSEEIGRNQATYERLVEESQSLNSQANEEVQRGNDIYKSTKDPSQAQPYWDKGEELRKEADQIEVQIKELLDQINIQSSQYNDQVNYYNSCIQK